MIQQINFWIHKQALRCDYNDFKDYFEMDTNIIKGKSQITNSVVL